ncbi:hypothetical protein L5515_013691 [Caenorhabditis briggsae]|uniref:Uncharacterized protein n=1 Tax=Caenorhabditis briggsae TaxID=6238 RepID=A0AAE9J7D4_CAEBR|nr:hypothetical protein L5515_013691 [Caenorhabditis briggsae]
MAEQMLLGCELGFKPDEKNPYFTMSTHLNTIKATYFATPLPHTAKEIRNAKNDGFTVQNLKNELAHLGLTTIFPEIQNHAELVYSEVDKRKKGSVLRTCDLFDAVEHCQLNCILERRPTFKKFLHNQNGCHRVYGFKCQECEKEKKTSEIWKTFEPVDEATEDTMSPEGKKSRDVKTSESQKKSPEASPSLQILQEHKVTQKESDEEIQKKSAEIEELKRKVEENLKIAEENEKLVSEATHLIDTIAELKKEHSKQTEKFLDQISHLEYELGMAKQASEMRSGKKKKSHTNCASNWLKTRKECPSCNGTFLNSNRN